MDAFFSIFHFVFNKKPLVKLKNISNIMLHIIYLLLIRILPHHPSHRILKVVSFEFRPKTIRGKLIL